MTVEQIIQGLAGAIVRGDDFDNEPQYQKEVRRVTVLLREKLGRVLEAGQAMRDHPGKLGKWYIDWDDAVAALDLPAEAGRGE